MNETFRLCIEQLHPAFERLMGMEPLKPCDLPATIPERGIYLFSERDRNLYVGRTNRLRKRIGEHCRPSSPHNSALFAFLLARKVTRRLKATYTTTGSREELCKSDPAFAKAFADAKNRVSRMDVRFVEERDALHQALLEMYVAITLRTPYNSFENH